MDAFFDQGLSTPDAFKACEMFVAALNLENPSPTLVQNFVDNLEVSGAVTRRKETDSHWSPKEVDSEYSRLATEGTGAVIEERHELGINDRMSGAIHPTQRNRLSQDFATRWELANDSTATVCVNEWHVLTEKMPHLLLSLPRIRKCVQSQIPSLDLADHLPDDSYITIRGLQRAIAEVEACTPEEEPYGSDLLLAGILKRVGKPKTAGNGRARDVLYPEDLESFIPATEPLFDHEYWEWIRAEADRGM